jgi:phosphatidylethanolamine/phosphatidyl-N-methylethanolamine N-methyltransferase
VTFVPGTGARPPVGPARSPSARRTFLAAAVRRPGQMGAVAPSSAHLAALLAGVVPREGSPVVVELGPGTGAISTAIAARLPAGSRHLAVELDPTMADYLRRTQPDLEVIEGDVVGLGAVLAERGVSGVDAVISGLPWSLFDHSTQDAILGQVTDAIGADGVFATFAYRHATPLAAARRFRRTLHEQFEDVEISRTVWRNLPPAFGYICRRPAAPTGG